LEGYIDLHSHTSSSDGTLSPKELVELARSEGLRAIAITDHDTVAGLPEALEHGKDVGIEVIPGVELSIEYDLPDNGHMHVLGLFIDIRSGALNDGLGWLRQKREERTPRILSILNNHGVEINAADVKEEAGEGSVGRPHIARAILKKGYASSIQEVFDHYLKKGALAYVSKEKFPPDNAIQMILDSGGLPILAHPRSLNLAETELRELILKMKLKGLKGIEAYYSGHSIEQTSLYLSMAEVYGLLVSGGTDFHGENKPDIRLGTGLGNLKIPYSLVDRMKEALGMMD